MAQAFKLALAGLVAATGIAVATPQAEAVTRTTTVADLTASPAMDLVAFRHRHGPHRPRGRFFGLGASPEAEALFEERPIGEIDGHVYTHTAPRRRPSNPYPYMCISCMCPTCFKR